MAGIRCSTWVVPQDVRQTESSSGTIEVCVGNDRLPMRKEPGGEQSNWSKPSVKRRKIGKVELIVRKHAAVHASINVFWVPRHGAYVKAGSLALFPWIILIPAASEPHDRRA